MTNFPCSLSQGALKDGFLDIYLTMFSGVGTSGNTSAMSVIVFWQMFKVKYRLYKCKKKVQKKFFAFDIAASELVAINCLD